MDFPQLSEHIKGVEIGQSGAFADMTQKTEMEMGQPKARVAHAAPYYNASVNVVCNNYGRLMINQFWLNDTAQGTKWFNWNWLNGFGDFVKMRFDGPIQNSQIGTQQLGLWKLTIKLMVRELPQIETSLMNEIKDVFGGQLEFITALDKLEKVTLEPEFDILGSL